MQVLDAIAAGAGLSPGISLDGLDLSSDAVNALARIPSEHAGELLEFVAKKKYELRDPSNYVLSTIARGFVSRKNPGSTVSAGAENGNTPELSAEALNALARIPREHAAELLDYVALKKNTLRDPSNYVLATINRGFASRKSPGAVSGPVSHGPPAGVAGTPLVDPLARLSSALVAAAAAVGSTTAAAQAPMLPAAKMSTAPLLTTALPSATLPANLPVPGPADADEDPCSRSLALAHQVGLQLSLDAVNALASLPPEQASELLEFVALRKDQLQDPNGYILSEVTRMLSTPGDVALYDSLAPVAIAPSTGAAAIAPLVANPELLPPDVSAVEQECLQLNASGIFSEQTIDVESLLALRCLTQEQALELLDQVQLKYQAADRGASVGNLNSYIRAAAWKIIQTSSSQLALPGVAPTLEQAPLATVDPIAGLASFLGLGGTDANAVEQVWKKVRTM